MTLSVTNLIDGIKNATYTFGIIREKLTEVFDYLLNATPAAGLIDTAKETIAGFVPIAAVIILLSVIELLFGKRLLGLQKFIFAFASGFAGGVLLLAPFIEGLVPGIPGWISGLAVAAVAALLYKLIYWIAFIFVSGYSVYMVFMSGAYLETITSITKGNMLVSLVIAGIVVLLALAFHKYVEILATAAIGTYGLFDGIKRIFDYTEFLSGVLYYAVFALVVFIGFAVQYKTRKRY